MGGLSRIAKVIEKTRSKGPTFVVDAGDLTWKSGSIATSRLAQQRAKADLQFEAYAMVGVDAMVPGDADLALGLEWLAGQVSEHSLPYVVANLTCDGLNFAPSRVVERDGFKMGFVGVVGPGQAGPCQAASTVPAIARAVEEMGPVDLTVLLSHQAAAEDASISTAIPGIDVIVNGQSRQQHRLPQKLSENAVQLANGTRGKKLGVAEIVLVSDAKGWTLEGAGEEKETQLRNAQTRRDRTQKRVDVAKSEKEKSRAEQRVRRLDQQIADLKAQIAEASVGSSKLQHRMANTLVGLDEDIGEHEKTQSLVDAAKVEIEKAAKVQLSAPVKPNRSYVGDAACKSCHQSQHSQWSSTPHANAWATLQEVQRSQDLDCWSCHVTGAHDPNGPQHPREAVGLENVGCESCHGPGRQHISAPSTKNISKGVSEAVCIDCHDGIKDEGRFDFGVYLPKVSH